ncbi:MAG: hypothetical protein ABIK92_08885 [Pseudomonadota bacterium]
MKTSINILLAILLIPPLCGCANTRGYLTDRGRDAADIITVTGGMGIGAKAHIGPFHGGLLAGADTAGLRGGRFYATNINPLKYNPDESKHSFKLHNDRPSMFLELLFFSLESTYPRVIDCRGKNYDAFGILLLSMVNNDNSSIADYPKHMGLFHPYYTQIEVAVGFTPMVCVGFNPGELFDFLIGFVGLDLFGDDLEKQKRESMVSGDQEGASSLDPCGD